MDDFNVKEVLTTMIQQLESLNRQHERLVNAVDSLIANSSKVMDPLINAMIQKTPEGTIPLETHNKVVKGIIWAFAVIIVAVLGFKEMVEAFKWF